MRFLILFFIVVILQYDLKISYIFIYIFFLAFGVFFPFHIKIRMILKFNPLDSLCMYVFVCVNLARNMGYSFVKDLMIKFII